MNQATASHADARRDASSYARHASMVTQQERWVIYHDCCYTVTWPVALKPDQRPLERWVNGARVWPNDERRRKSMGKYHTDHEVQRMGERTDRYIAGGGMSCPFCGSTNIEGDLPGFDEDGSCSQRVTCQACGRHWWDLYTLTDVLLGEAIEATKAAGG